MGEPIVPECGDGLPSAGELCFDDATLLTVGDLGYSPRVAEVSGDGRVDLIYLYGDEIIVRLGNGSGDFGPELSGGDVFCTDMELADVDGDNLLDHVCVNTYDTSLSVSLGNGSGSFTLQPESMTIPGNAAGLVVGDLNGDGNADVVTTHGAAGGSGSVRVSLSLGNGQFQAGAWVSCGNNLPCADVTLGDFTGDGNDDIALTAGEGAQQLRVLINDGSGGFGSLLVANVTTDAAFGVDAGDFNDDGTSDVALANGGNVLAMLGNGIASFEGTESLSTPDDSIATHVAVADVNNDALDDVLAIYSNQPIVSVFPSNGDGTFAERVDFVMGALADSVATGDVNEDGIPDIVLGSISSEVVTVFLSTP